MIPALGLAFASLGAVLVWSRSGFFAHGFTDARLICVAAGMIPAAHFHKWRMSRGTWPVLIYGACLIPSLLFTRSLQMSLFGHPGIYSGSVLTFLLCAAGLLIAEQLEDEYKPYVKTAIFCAGTATVLICMAQAAHVDPFQVGPWGNRAIGLLGSPVDAGAFFVVLLTFAPAGLIPAYLLGLWATLTRGAWMGGAVALTPKRFRLYVAAAAVAFAALCTLSHPEVDRERKAIWDVAAHHMSVLGSGPATFALVFAENWKPAEHPFPSSEKVNPAHAHNSILDALVTRGIFGLLGLLALFTAPELAGLWAVCMFNPISFEVTFVACVLVGLSRSPK